MGRQGGRLRGWGRFVLLAAVVASLLAACQATVTPAPSAAPSVSPSAGPVVVTLGIYSGRADPEWTLTAEQAATLQTMLAALAEQTATPPVGGLGYHGFTIRGPASTLVAYQGFIAPSGEGPRASRADPTRSVERFLLDTGRARLDAVEIATVESALR